MKRSEINQAIQKANTCFAQTCYALPPNPAWDVTDFGLGDFAKKGLVLVNLADEPEYCEKLMYATKGQTTPAHTHLQKKEDIICRSGILSLRLWKGSPAPQNRASFSLKQNGSLRDFVSGNLLTLSAGERVTLVPGIYHAFWPESDECIIGEVSTANDDQHDNVFHDPEIGRYPGIEEDAKPIVRLLSELAH